MSAPAESDAIETEGSAPKRETSMNDKVFRSAVAIIPPEDLWEPIQRIRMENDRAYPRWMPHINLLYPFISDAYFAEVAPAMQAVIGQLKPFEINFRKFSAFEHGKSRTVYLKPEEDEAKGGADPQGVDTAQHAAIQGLYSALEKLFPQCNDLSNKSEHGFAPHLTVGQFSRQTYPKFQAKMETEWQPIRFIVDQIYIISRADVDDPFHIRRAIKLGSSFDPEKPLILSQIAPITAIAPVHPLVNSAAAAEAKGMTAEAEPVWVKVSVEPATGTEASVAVVPSTGPAVVEEKEMDKISPRLQPPASPALSAASAGSDKNSQFYLGGIDPALIEEVAARDEDEEPHPGHGVFLPRGFLATNHALTQAELEFIRSKRWSAKIGAFIDRAAPLSDEELQCWVDQNEWLACPITGTGWRDNGAILGAAIYHAPRFLSAEETQRQSQSAKEMDKRKKARAAMPNPAVEDEKAVPIDDPEDDDDAFFFIGSDGAETEEADEKAMPSERAEMKAVAADPVDRDDSEERVSVGSTPDQPEYFQVYPRVSRPPAHHIKPLGPLPDDVRVGHMEVMVGPVFDVDAYNDGAVGNKDKRILGAEERGSLDFDQQYNALNFCYYTDLGNRNFFRKVCTNRLSFFIEERHGSRVFPENIESQLSLLVYRDSQRLKANQGPTAGLTDQKLLASAVKKCIPRILKSIVLELNKCMEAGWTASACGNKDFDRYFDHSLRVYLLIHQVSIKLVLHYPEAHAALYRSVFRWIQNPFAKKNHAEWPDLEEVLIAASLVGIKWPYMREAFIRKLVATLLRSCDTMSESAPMYQRVRHMFAQNATRLRRILYEFSFFIAGHSLVDLDRTYTRCAGTLPRSERERMKATAKEAKEVDCMEKFWQIMGMDSPLCTEQEVNRHIIKYFEYVTKSIAQWQSVAIEARADQFIPVPTAHAPDSEEAEVKADGVSVATAGLIGYKNAAEKELEKHMAAERLKHRGLPLLDNHGKLPKNVCLFPQCQRKFNNRAHLFAHLLRYIPAMKESKGYHQAHFKLHISAKNLPSSGPFVCTAPGCGEEFDTRALLVDHFERVGVPSFWSWDKQQLNRNQELAGAEVKEKEIDPWDDPSVCVVCLDMERALVFVPCGHLATCRDCGISLHACPLCRAQVDDAIPTQYAEMRNVRVFK